MIQISICTFLYVCMYVYRNEIETTLHTTVEINDQSYASYYAIIEFLNVTGNSIPDDLYLTPNFSLYLCPTVGTIKSQKGVI